MNYLVTLLLTYLFTYNMEQSPSREANRLSASQEIPRILWNPKVLEDETRSATTHKDIRPPRGKTGAGGKHRNTGNISKY